MEPQSAFKMILVFVAHFTQGHLLCSFHCLAGWKRNSIGTISQIVALRQNVNLVLSDTTTRKENIVICHANLTILKEYQVV